MQLLLHWLWSWPAWTHTLIANRLGGWRIVKVTWRNSDRKMYLVERWINNKRG